MNSLFNDVADHVVAYIDDVAILRKTWEEHLDHIRDILQRFRKANLTVKAKKCQMAMAECLLLGHIVERGQVKPDAAKICDLLNFRQPRTKKDVRS